MISKFIHYFIFFITLYIFNVTCRTDFSDNYNTEIFYNRTINVLNRGKKIARRYGHDILSPIHILSALLKNEYCEKLLTGSINVHSMNELVDIALEQTRLGEPLDNKVIVTHSDEINELLASAESVARKYEEKKVNLEHLLSALKNCNLINEIFNEVYLTEEVIKNILRNKYEENKKNKRKSQKLFIDEFSSNLNEKVRKGKIHRIYGRDEEIRTIIESLLRYNKNSPVLVGHPGIGKTSIIEGFAYRIEKKDVPKELQDYTLLSLNLRKFSSGISYRGEFETRMKKMIKELKNKKSKIILFIDEIHLLLGSGKFDGDADAANILKPVLARGEIKLIGATTLEEYRKFIEKSPAFERRFDKLIIQPPSVETTIKILRSLKSKYEDFYKVNISNKAIISAVKVADQFIKDRYLPDKAIDLLNKACSFLQVQLSSKPRIIDVTERDLERLSYEISTLEMDFDKLSRKKHKNIIKEFETKKEELKMYYKEYITTGERLKRKKDIEKKFKELKGLVKNYLNLNKEPPLKLKISLEEEQKKYIGVIKEISAYVEEKTYNSMNIDSVYQEHVSYIYLRDSGMPIGSLYLESAKNILKLYNNLSRAIIGNEDVIKALSDAVVKAATGMKDPDKPIGTFLFLGPTGVGKTELAKALAIELFNSSDNLIRVSMSEYTEAHSVSKIAGSPPGYVGYSDSGHLTEAVREKPHSVILFDELEKAHPDVFKVLLQIIGDGFIHDNHRKHIDFTNTIILMTSNLGSELIKKKLFFDADKPDNKEYKKLFDNVKNLLIKKCKKTFKPEFVNRIDKIGVFEILNKKKLYKIIILRFEKLEKRLEQKNIHISLSPKAINYIVEQSYDPELGARPTLRFIESIIMTKLSIMYVKKELIDDMNIYIDINNNNKMVINLSID